jgi:hypothetical protein
MVKTEKPIKKRRAHRNAIIVKTSICMSIIQ